MSYTNPPAEQQGRPETDGTHFEDAPRTFTNDSNLEQSTQDDERKEDVGSVEDQEDLIHGTFDNQRDIDFLPTGPDPDDDLELEAFQYANQSMHEDVRSHFSESSSDGEGQPFQDGEESPSSMWDSHNEAISEDFGDSFNQGSHIRLSSSLSWEDMQKLAIGDAFDEDGDENMKNALIRFNQHVGCEHPPQQGAESGDLNTSETHHSDGTISAQKPCEQPCNVDESDSKLDMVAHLEAKTVLQQDVEREVRRRLSIDFLENFSQGSAWHNADGEKIPHGQKTSLSKMRLVDEISPETSPTKSELQIESRAAYEEHEGLEGAIGVGYEAAEHGQSVAEEVAAMNEPTHGLGLELGDQPRPPPQSTGSLILEDSTYNQNDPGSPNSVEELEAVSGLTQDEANAKLSDLLDKSQTFAFKNSQQALHVKRMALRLAEKDYRVKNINDPFADGKDPKVVATWAMATAYDYRNRALEYRSQRELERQWAHHYYQLYYQSSGEVEQLQTQLQKVGSENKTLGNDLRATFDAYQETESRIEAQQESFRTQAQGMNDRLAEWKQAYEDNEPFATAERLRRARIDEGHEEMQSFGTQTDGLQAPLVESHDRDTQTDSNQPIREVFEMTEASIQTEPEERAERGAPETAEFGTQTEPEKRARHEESSPSPPSFARAQSNGQNPPPFGQPEPEHAESQDQRKIQELEAANRELQARIKQLYVENDILKGNSEAVPEVLRSTRRENVNLDTWMPGFASSSAAIEQWLELPRGQRWAVREQLIRNTESFRRTRDAARRRLEEETAVAEKLWKLSSAQTSVSC